MSQNGIGKLSGILASILFQLVAYQTAETHPTVRNYDENVVATNTVDFTAPGSSMTASEFVSTVALAYDRNQGGVMNGEYVTSTSAQIQFGVSQIPTLDFNIPTNWGISGNNITGTAISNSGKWGTNSSDFTNPRVAFEFPNVITGGNVGERVAQIGLTVLSNGQHSLGSVQGIVTFSGGGSQNILAQIPLGLATHDTFYGAIAPAGQWITRFELSAYNGGEQINRMSFDDLGFVTTAFVPEPTTCCGALVGALLLAFRRARRRVHWRPITYTSKDRQILSHIGD